MIKELKRKLKSLAIADAIIEPEWEYRYFSYNSLWGQNEEMASMRDGSGGHWFVLFEPNKIAYKCISPNDGLLENIEQVEKQIPVKYKKFLQEPAFYVGKATSIWVLEQNKWIKFGKSDVKNLLDLEQVITWIPEDYQSWGEKYYEREIDIIPLKQVFNLNLSINVVKALNPEISYSDLQNDLNEIGIIS